MIRDLLPHAMQFADASNNPSELGVAVGIILDSTGRVLITQRPNHVPHGGLWEFPGGKIEPDESPSQALRREIKEEVGLIITAERLQSQIEHHYPRQAVRLFVFHVIHFVGSAVCLAEQLDLRWVHLPELNQYAFPEANKAIINHLITDK